jgi:Skp family chaperone for outer membrane proteins
MMDLIADTVALGDEMSDEEAQMRKEVTEEVFEGAAPVVDDIAVEIPDEDGPKVVTADEEVPPESGAIAPEVAVPDINQALSSINDRLAALGNIDNRMKQAERRIGAIQNDASAAKKKVESAPSKEAVADAAKNDAAWEELKADFPEWAVAIEGKIAASRTKMPDVSSLREELTSVKNTMVASQDFEERLVRLMHPGWVKTINTPDYKNWLLTQPADIQALHNKGETADDAVHVLNLFKESKSKVVPNTNTVKSRDKRLAQSVTKETSHKTTPIKSEADMSEQELRQTIANEVWEE